MKDTMSFSLSLPKKKKIKVNQLLSLPELKLKICRRNEKAREERETLPVVSIPSVTGRSSGEGEKARTKIDGEIRERIRVGLENT